MLYSKWGYSSYHLELNCLCLCAGRSLFGGNLKSFGWQGPFSIKYFFRDPNLAVQAVIAVFALLTAAGRNVSVSFLIFHALLFSCFRQVMQYQ